MDKVYKKDDTIDGQYRTLDVLVKGGLSRVYNVLNLDQNRIYAMKILAKPEDADLIQYDYNAVVRSHPCNRRDALNT